MNNCRKNQKTKEKVIELSISEFKKFHEKNSILKEIQIPEISFELGNKNEMFRIIREENKISINEDENAFQNITLALSVFHGEGFKEDILKDTKLNKNREEDEILLNVLRRSLLNHINYEIWGKNIMNESSIVKKILTEDKEKMLLKMYFKMEKMYNEKYDLNPPLSRELINQIIEKYSWDERFHRICPG
jgi:hypothetical protein